MTIDLNNTEIVRRKRYHRVGTKSVHPGMLRLTPREHDQIRLESKLRGLTLTGLLNRIIATLVRDDLFRAVLDD